jgi:Fic family protein
MFFDFDIDEVREQLGEIDQWRERLDLRRPLSRRWEGRLRRDLEAEAVAASTRLEGIPVTVDDVRRILVGDAPKQVSPQDFALVRGYRDAMTYVLRRADDQNFEWNRELLVGVHDRVLAGRFEDGAGRLRTGQTQVASRKTGKVIFDPPPASRVPEFVDQTCEKLCVLEDHAAVRAAWFHVTFAAVHPFRDGNGRTARVLSSLIMYRGEFRTRAFTSLEEWWGRHPDDYYDAFKCLGSQFDPAVDVTPFIRTHVNAQLSQIRALDLRERTLRGLWTVLENVLEDRELPDRLANALWDAFWGYTVTAGSYRGVNDVSPATATADLRAATAAGLLKAVGERRGRHYLSGRRLFTLAVRELGIKEKPESADSGRALVISELSNRLHAQVAPDADPVLFYGLGDPKPAQSTRVDSGELLQRTATCLGPYRGHNRAANGGASRGARQPSSPAGSASRRGR